ncbi:MAG: hypothetical protein ACK41Q_11660 [Candidatus Brocadia sp.]
MGLVAPGTDKESREKTYALVPHIDPLLQNRYFLSNEHGGFGEWQWAVSKDTADITNILEDAMSNNLSCRIPLAEMPAF